MKNKNAIYTTIGASNHVQDEREENDYYATDPLAMELLLEQEKFNQSIWEVASGGGHLVDVLREHGHNVLSTDLIDRGVQDSVLNFLSYDGELTNHYNHEYFTHDGKFNGDIITNPPYKYAKEFVEKALDVIPNGNKVAMFLKLTFLEGKARKELFNKYPFKTLYVSSSRIKCAKNGDFGEIKSSAVAYGWYVWEKGFEGSPEIKWIN